MSDDDQRPVPGRRASLDPPRAEDVEPAVAKAFKPVIRSAIAEDRRRRRRRLALPVALLLLAIVLGFVALRWKYGNDQTATGRRLDAATAAEETLRQQVVELGGTPRVGPSGAAGATGAAGPGPSAEQIAAAVAGYCAARSGCAGSPSRQQVFAAVTTYCETGICRGRTGATGQSGASGQPGASGSPGPTGAEGDTGPGPTDDQIAAAVAAFCAAHGDCAGPAGAKGDTGRGIAKVDCTALGVTQLVLHYDDGTEQVVDCTTPGESQTSDSPSSSATTPSDPASTPQTTP